MPRRRASSVYSAFTSRSRRGGSTPLPGRNGPPPVPPPDPSPMPAPSPSPLPVPRPVPAPPPTPAPWLSPVSRPRSTTPSRSRSLPAVATTGATRTRDGNGSGASSTGFGVGGGGGGTGFGGSSTRRDASTRSGETAGTTVLRGTGLLRSTFRAGRGFLRPPPPPPPPGPGVTRKTMRVGSRRSSTTGAVSPDPDVHQRSTASRTT
jgi:hypothetical protein